MKPGTQGLPGWAGLSSRLLSRLCPSAPELQQILTACLTLDTHSAMRGPPPCLHSTASRECPCCLSSWPKPARAASRLSSVATSSCRLLAFFPLGHNLPIVRWHVCSGGTLYMFLSSLLNSCTGTGLSDSSLCPCPFLYPASLLPSPSQAWHSLLHKVGSVTSH